MPPTATDAHLSRPAQERINALRRIVARATRARVDGTMIDAFSASAALAVYAALRPQNQAKLAELPAKKIVALSLEALDRQRKHQLRS